MENTITLPVTEIQRFCMHDGPGVRTTVFLKGCPLRCEWCHNPEAQRAEQEILFDEKKCILCFACASVCERGCHAAGSQHSFNRANCSLCESCVGVCPTRALSAARRNMTLAEILGVIKKDLAFYGGKGGMTLSGGEPLIHGEPVCELLRLCKKLGISTAVETCGYFKSEILQKAVKYTDIFLWDVKDTNSERHRRYTGVTNEKILENLFLADRMGAKTRLRCILVKGINTDVMHYTKIADVALSLENCEGVEFIPYHAYGGSKMLLLGRADNGNTDFIPLDADIALAKSTLASRGVKVF